MARTKKAAVTAVKARKTKTRSADKKSTQQQPIKKPVKSPSKPRKTRSKRGNNKHKVSGSPSSSSSSPEKQPEHKDKKEKKEKKREPSESPTATPPSKVPKNNLERVFGHRGSSFLYDALTTWTDPTAKLHEFRAEEGILIPSLPPAIALLDLMEVKRVEFHMLCVEELRRSLMDRITNANKSKGDGKQKQLEALLDQCFPGLNLPLIRPIVLHVLRNLNTVADKYKKEIMNDKDLYDVCDTPLRRQIWLDRKDLFEAEMFPLFDEWMANRRRTMFDVNAASDTTTSGLYTNPGNIRRQDKALVKMVENVGDSIQLYGYVVELIRRRYIATGNPHYGTLRLDFLILLHEHQPEVVNKADVVLYKFAFCMDACVRSRHVDQKRYKEITEVLDLLKKKDIVVLQDIAMILAEPQITYFNAATAMRLAHAVTNQKNLPRDNAMLLFSIRLLSIGLRAKDYVSEKLQKEPKLSTDLCCNFLPKFCSVMVSLAAKKLTTTSLKKATLGLDVLLPFLKKEPIAVWLILQWIAYLLRDNEQDLVMKIFEYFPQFVGQMPLMEEHIVHSVVVQLAHTVQERKWSQAFADGIFRGYLGTLDKNIQNSLHILRLLYYVYPKLEPRYRDELLQDLQAQVETDAEVKAMHATVSARIATSVPMSPLKLDSPLTPFAFRSPDYITPRPQSLY